MHIQYLHITIEKGAGTKIPLVVPFYEYAILSEAHNTDTDEGTIENVHVNIEKADEGREIRALPDDFDVDDEFSRLLAAYGKGENARFIRRLWRDEEAFEEAIEKNSQGCEKDIKAGVKVSEAAPMLLVNPEIKRGRRRSRMATGDMTVRVAKPDSEVKPKTKAA